jgi:hypothetical protein
MNLSYIQRLGPKAELQDPSKVALLESGDLLHAVFKVFYTFRIERPDLPYSRCIDLACNFGRAYAMKLNQTLEESEDILFHCVEYFKFYEGEIWTPVAVEKPFAVKLYESEEDNLRIVYDGIVDLIVDTPRGLLGVDHKKSSRRLDPGGLTLANQFKGYAYALDMRHFVVNEVGTQKTKKPGERFLRHTLLYSDEIIEEWRKNVVYRAQELAFFLKNNSWPQNFAACKMTPDGQYQIPCNFQEICKSDPGKARDFVKMEFFAEKPEWSPQTRDVEIDEIMAELVKSA